MSSLTVMVSDEAIPFKPIKLSSGANQRFVKAFYTQFWGTGKMYYNAGNDISREEFSKAYTLYTFDLTPDMCGSSPHSNRVQKGNLSLELQFSAPLPVAISLVCCGEFENLIQIKSSGGYL